MPNPFPGAHLIGGIVVVPVKCEPSLNSSPTLRSADRSSVVASVVSHAIFTPSPNRPTSVMPSLTLVGTLSVTHLLPFVPGSTFGQFSCGVSWMVPSIEPTCSNVTPMFVGINPNSFTLAWNGGTNTLPVTVPSKVGSSAVASPLNVEPSGRLTAWFSFLGVSDPDSTQFLNVLLIENADAGAAETDIAPTAARVAASAVTRLILRDMLLPSNPCAHRALRDALVGPP